MNQRLLNRPPLAGLALLNGGALAATLDEPRGTPLSATGEPTRTNNLVESPGLLGVNLANNGSLVARVLNNTPRVVAIRLMAPYQVSTSPPINHIEVPARSRPVRCLDMVALDNSYFTGPQLVALGIGGNQVCTSDRIRLQYAFDGGPWVTAGLLMGNNAITPGRPGNGVDFQQITNLSDSVSVTNGNAPAGNGTVFAQMSRDIWATIARTTVTCR